MGSKVLNHTIFKFVDLLSNEDLIASHEKKQWFGIANKQAKYFGEQPVIDALDTIASKVLDGWKPTFNGLPGYFRSIVLSIKRDKERGLPPIKVCITKIPYCDPLNTEFLKQIMRDINTGNPPQELSFLPPEELQKEVEFLDKVLEEWEFVNESILRSRPDRQHDLFGRYNNYRKTIGWDRDLMEHKRRINKG